MRMGQGFDAHAFSEDRPLVLGGVRVDYPRGLAGDSDGDVLTHAIIDAVLGGLAAGDLGTWFRADDPTVRGARSVDLLARVMKMATDRGYGVEQVDVTLIGEAPKVRPLVAPMRDQLAPVLGVAAEDISIKGTTTDKMGWLGREEGLACLAIVQLRSISG